MRSAARLVPVLALLTAATAIAQADTRTSQTGQVSIDVPAGWKIEAQNDVLMTIQDPSSEVGVLFWVVDQGDVGKAAKLLDEQIGRFAQNVQWAGKPTRTEINGLPGIAMKGSATVEGKAAKAAVFILKTPNGKGLIVLAMVQADRKEHHEPSLKALFGSLRPAAR